MRKASVTPVLLTQQQVEALKQLQVQERDKSPLGIVPTIHAIARQLMDKALLQVKGGL